MDGRTERSREIPPSLPPSFPLSLSRVFSVFSHNKGEREGKTISRGLGENFGTLECQQSGGAAEIINANEGEKFSP